MHARFFIDYTTTRCAQRDICRGYLKSRFRQSAYDSDPAERVNQGIAADQLAIKLANRVLVRFPQPPVPIAPGHVVLPSLYWTVDIYANGAQLEIMMGRVKSSSLLKVLSSPQNAATTSAPRQPDRPAAVESRFAVQTTGHPRRSSSESAPSRVRRCKVWGRRRSNKATLRDGLDLRRRAGAAGSMCNRCRIGISYNIVRRMPCLESIEHCL